MQWQPIRPMHHVSSFEPMTSLDTMVTSEMQSRRGLKEDIALMIYCHKATPLDTEKIPQKGQMRNPL